MDWILFWQIAGPIIGLIGIVAMVALFLWPRREKVEIKYANMYVQLLETNKTTTGIKIECTFSLLYARGTRDCYISETWLELDKRLWKSLRVYFKEVPLRMGGIPCPDGLKKLELGKRQPLGIDSSSRACRVITDEEREELDNLVQKLWYRYRIGWKDSYGKTHWKTINQLRELQKAEVM